MMEDLFEKAERLIHNGNYKGAWEMLASITQQSANPDEQADAYQMLGGLAQVSPSLSTDDECGLSFYKKAVNCVPNHLWSLFGIVSTFGLHFPDHQDVAAVSLALQQLTSRYGELDSSAIALIAKKRKLLESMENDAVN